MTQRTPSVGRIVLYNYRGTSVPAIVVSCDVDEGCTLFVILPHTATHFHGVQQGDDEGQWHWPVLV